MSGSGTRVARLQVGAHPQPGFLRDLNGRRASGARERADGIIFAALDDTVPHEGHDNSALRVPLD